MGWLHLPLSMVQILPPWPIDVKTQSALATRAKPALDTTACKFIVQLLFSKYRARNDEEI